MRFFSNEAKDNADDRDPEDRTGTVQSEPVAVPAQRAGSPWQHGPADGDERPPVHEPAPQPTAFGASTVGGAVAASAAANPQEAGPRPTDRTTDAASGVADDRTVPLNEGEKTVPLNSTAPDTDRPAETRKDEAAVDEALEDHGTFEDPKVTDEAAVDLALEDRGTFDDPKVVEEAKQETEKDQPDQPAKAGPAPFFPAADTDALRERWRDVQLRFVDDPKGATAEAAGLVDEAVDKLTAALRDQRGSLAKGTDDTEALRVELRSYRDILDRLLGL